MESLVQLARIGPDVVPALVATLEKGSPTAREFAAQALVLFGDARARPALEKALNDLKEGVRLYAVQALSMIGPLPAEDRYYRMLESDPCHFGVKPMVAAALGREDKAKPDDLRKAFADYDLSKMNTACLGELAPDFMLYDANGKPVRLSDFRGKKAVVLRFILFDF
jgi:HEAT repeat protein